MRKEHIRQMWAYKSDIQKIKSHAARHGKAIPDFIHEKINDWEQESEKEESRLDRYGGNNERKRLF